MTGRDASTFQEDPSWASSVVSRIPLINPVCRRVKVPGIAYSGNATDDDPPDDSEILERICTAYRHDRAKAGARAAIVEGQVWGAGGWQGRQADLISALESGDKTMLAQILRTFFASHTAHGIAMGSEEHHIVASSAEHAAIYGIQWLDALVALSHTVGAVRAPNPEVDREAWERSLEVDPEEVALAIEAETGIPMEFPNICAVYGPTIKGRVFPTLALSHFFVAHYAMKLLNGPSPSVKEIGGGFGGLAFFLLRSVEVRYCIFDLPYACAIQAYFLSQALPDICLRLFGEAQQASARSVQILPAWSLLAGEDPIDDIDLLVNQDCLGDLDGNTALAYLRNLVSGLRGPFLSIGPDVSGSSRSWAGHRIAELASAAGGLVLVDRVPFPLRRGYFREIYTPVR